MILGDIFLEIIFFFLIFWYMFTKNFTDSCEKERILSVNIECIIKETKRERIYWSEFGRQIISIGQK